MDARPLLNPAPADIVVHNAPEEARRGGASRVLRQHAPAGLAIPGFIRRVGGASPLRLSIEMPALRTFRDSPRPR